MTKIPELLAPAGSYSAFVAAISAGADAVYMGGASFNARIGAKNFTPEELERAIKEAHLLGRKVYITLNTLVSDRELNSALEYAESLMKMGADAFIVQDLGLMRALSLYLPEAEVHGSTQCIAHSLDGVSALEELGAKRVVVARELDRENIAHICKSASAEIEVFVHGALCVCHSGACLFSSLVGGRSGNRGECAQPCRLPYKVGGIDSDYPLSLKDLTLSEHLTELSEMGVASLKIEGRMKSEDYVGNVVGIFRALLDSGKNADKNDVERLARIFSRGGFTSGYYAKRLGPKMFGVRSAEDKQTTRELEKEGFALPKIPLNAEMELTAKGARLTVASGDMTASSHSAPPDTAISRPIDEESAREQISKLGQTVFELRSFKFYTDGDYILPKSALNALRRDALDALVNVPEVKKGELDTIETVPSEKYERYIVFAPHRFEKSVPKGVDRAYFPLFKTPEETERVGVLLPVVIKDSERAEVVHELEALCKKGVRYALAESIGSARLALNLGFKVMGGARMNAYNSHTLQTLCDMGLEGIVLSSELTPPMKRDIAKPLPSGEVIYGRAPLMVMENCVMNLRDSCRECSDFKVCRRSAELVDRKGISFPVYPEFFHRCQIYNSVVTYNADRPKDGMSFGIIYITDENVDFALKAVLDGTPPKKYTRQG